MKTLTAVMTICVIALIALPGVTMAQSWQVYTKAGCPLPDTSVSAIAFDNGGNTWVGMTEQGLLKYNGTDWTLIDDPNMPAYIGINDIKWHDGVLWVAPNDGKGLAKWNGTEWSRISSSNSGLTNDAPHCIAFDGAGNMWIGTQEGLAVWKTDNTWLTYLSTQTNTHFPSDFINHISISRDGYLWLSFYSAYGMVMFNPTTGVGTPIDPNSYPELPADHISSMAMDWDNNVWASTFNYGIAKINGANVTVYSLSSDPAFISNHVYAVNVDHCGNVWIGTDAGVAKYDGSTWTKYSMANSSLPHNRINAITLDDVGHVWIATDGNGLAEYKPLTQKIWLTAPMTSTIVTVDTVLCNWAWGCPGIQKYWFEYADNAAFSNSSIDTSMTSFAATPNWQIRNLINHTTYYWRVKAKNDQGWGPFSDAWQFTVNQPLGVSSTTECVENFSLEQNTPNPFSEATKITFVLGKREHVRLSICDLLGREIAVPVDDELAAGNHNVNITASSFGSAMRSSGVFVYRMLIGNVYVQKMMEVVR